MEIKEQELVQIKKTKFVEMYWNDNKKEVQIWQVVYFDGERKGTINTYIPINKIPQVIRGLFSAYTRFHKRGYVKKAKRK